MYGGRWGMYIMMCLVLAMLAVLAGPVVLLLAARVGEWGVRELAFGAVLTGIALVGAVLAVASHVLHQRQHRQTELLRWGHLSGLEEGEKGGAH